MLTAPHIESLNAVTLGVTDLVVSRRFYEVLGFTDVAHEQADFASIHAGTGFLNLQLVASAPAGVWGRPIFHVADVDAVHDAAVEAGFTPDFAPKDAVWGERYFHIKDPDGHEISFAKLL